MKKQQLVTNLDKKTLSNTQKALRYEWLETNGLGSYSCSTIINCNIRKYHGLLNCKINNSDIIYNLLN